MVFRYKNINVRYEDTGEGEPVLMLHGWGGKAESFLPLIRDLTSYRRISLDFPGHGESDEPTEPWHVRDFADCVLALLDQLGVRKTVIAAHSFGGRVAIWIASHAPERVAKMVLTGCAGLTREDKNESAKAKIMAGAEKLPLFKKGSFLREAAIKLMGSRDYKALSPSMRETFSLIVNEDLREYLPRVTCPVILLWGTLDTETPIAMGEEMQRKMKDAALIPLEGGTHFAYLEQYPRFFAITKAFLEG